MDVYWFADWLKRYQVHDERSLQSALARPKTLDSLLEAAPQPIIAIRQDPPEATELTAGKGIDLTGALGCRHIDCLSKEIEGLFRHTWHYFDRIVLPDQALSHILDFQDHHDTDELIDRLSPFVTLLRFIDVCGGRQLVRFEVRAPSCGEHLHQHAREAGIDHTVANIIPLVGNIADTGVISWKIDMDAGHPHLNYQVVHPWFEHTEWGSICSARTRIPEEEDAIRVTVATAIVQRYLAELSADALAAHRSRTPLGATIPFFRRLLATHPSSQIDEVAFELALPISPDIPVASLIEIRKNERDSFERFQTALRTAIRERVQTATTPDAAAIAQDIKRDIIDPELRRIRDRLSASRMVSFRGAATGVGLGSAAATVGLMTPLVANPVGAGLAVGGAITLAASSVKKAVDDHLVTKRDVLLSDMYFLWQAHRH